MALQPYIGEIMMFGGNFAILGWAFTGGQLVSTTDNAALFSLIGTTYGGTGQATFALPNLAGRAPMHAGSAGGLTTKQLGQASGATSATPPSLQTPRNFLAGSGQSVIVPPVNTQMPYLTINFLIALSGIFPSQT